MSEELLEAIEVIKKAFVNLWERIKLALVRVGKLLQVVKKDHPKTRVRYDPIRKIILRKPRLFDKRTNMYYCRNNC